MLKIDIELHPHGRPEASKRLHRIVIGSRGPAALTGFYKYDYWIWDEDQQSVSCLDENNPPLGQVVHLRRKGALALLDTVLQDFYL